MKNKLVFFFNQEYVITILKFLMKGEKRTSMGTQNDFIAMHPFHLQVKILLPVNTLITASALTHSRESPLPSQRPALAGLQCCELRPVEGERSPQGSLSLSNPRL